MGTSVYFDQSAHTQGAKNSQRYYHTTLVKMDNNTNEMKISLTFVRHGRSEGNQIGLMQGQSNTPLAEDGKKQACLAGAALRHVRFDTIYSSDQERAYDTALLIAAQQPKAPQGSLDPNCNIIETNKLLRERCYGVLELRRQEEFCLQAEANGFQGQNRYDFVPEGAESKQDVRKRAAEFLEYVFKSVSKNDKSNDETHNILIVSHSGFLVQLAHHFFKDCDCRLPVSSNRRIEDELTIWMDKAVKNTAITTYEVKINYDTKEILDSECTRYGCVDHLIPEL